MSLICVTSAKGAPGTTTTAMLLAALWPRPSILVDADPLGGDVALRLPDESGAAMTTGTGLISLLSAARRGLGPDVVLSHCQTALGGQQVIPGLDGPEQASAVATVWDELGHALNDLDEYDVVADLGQSHVGATTLPLLRRATVVVVVLRPSVTSVVHTRQRIASLLPELTAPDGGRPLLAYVLVEEGRGRPGDTNTAIAQLAETSESLRYLGAIAHDPGAVQMFEGVPVRRPERSLLVRSATQVVSDLEARVHPDEEAPAVPEAASADQPTAQESTESASAQEVSAASAEADHDQPRRRARAAARRTRTKGES